MQGYLVESWDTTLQIEYFVFLLKPCKLVMNRNKTKAIKVWEKLTTKKELQSFLGLANYYRWFIRNRSEIAWLLTELTKNVLFNWSKSAQNPSNQLNQTTTTASALAYLDLQKKIYVTTDGCKYAIVAILERDHHDGRHHVEFTSRTLYLREQY